MFVNGAWTRCWGLGLLPVLRDLERGLEEFMFLFVQRGELKELRLMRYRQLNNVEVLGLDYVCSGFFISFNSIGSWFHGVNAILKKLVRWDSKSTVMAGRAGPFVGLCGVCHVGSAGKVR